ncbi:hypothetical protein JCM24511_09528 [Saitozyma sp. JCM 24511]|nr:hypothetical protein JCM24511_09528 [Saitozyma sp. JCM 24511]
MPPRHEPAKRAIETALATVDGVKVHLEPFVKGTPRRDDIRITGSAAGGLSSENMKGESGILLADGSFGETKMAPSYIHEMYGLSRSPAMKAPAKSNTYQEGQMRNPRFSP